MMPSNFIFTGDFGFFFLHVHSATGFLQDGQILPDSVEYTNRELSIYFIGSIHEGSLWRVELTSLDTG